MSHLIPCAGCARHVSISETRCPFCETAREPTAPPAGSINVRGLSRSALLVAGALALGACEASNASRNDNSSQASGYGGPPQADPSSGSSNDDAGTNASAADAGEPTNVVAIYGAPTPGVESKR